MTKQEEILNETAHIVIECRSGAAIEVARQVLKYLHSQGVVIKIDKEDADFYYEPLIWEGK